MDKLLVFHKYGSMKRGYFKLSVVCARARLTTNTCLARIRHSLTVI